jgi:hypothetical protein
MRLNEKSKEMSIENHMLCDGWIETWKLKLKEKNMNEWMNEFGWIWIWKKKSFLRFLSLFRSLYLRLGKVTLSVSLMLEKRHGNSFTHVIALFNIFSVHSFLFYFHFYFILLYC